MELQNTTAAIANVLPHVPAFSHEEYLIGIPVVWAITAGVDFVKTQVEHSDARLLRKPNNPDDAEGMNVATSAYNIANPEIATNIDVRSRREIFRQRAGIYLGATGLSFTLLALAGPHVTEVVHAPETAIVINADFPQECSVDTSDSNSRYNDAVEGAAEAAQDNRNIPFKFILDGTSSVTVNQPTNPSATSWKAAITSKQNYMLNNGLLNGENIANADQTAIASVEQSGGDTISITSGFDGNVDGLNPASEQSELDTIAAPADAKASTVVIGEQASQCIFDGEPVTGSYDPQAFPNAVKADSAKDVEKDIDSILANVKIKISNHEVDWPLDAAFASFVGVLGVLYYNRFSGATLMLRSYKNSLKGLFSRKKENK